MYRLFLLGLLATVSMGFTVACNKPVVKPAGAISQHNSRIQGPTVKVVNAADNSPVKAEVFKTECNSVEVFGDSLLGIIDTSTVHQFNDLTSFVYGKPDQVYRLDDYPDTIDESYNCMYYPYGPGKYSDPLFCTYVTLPDHPLILDIIATSHEWIVHNAKMKNIKEFAIVYTLMTTTARVF